MAKGTALSEQSTGENIQRFSTIRNLATGQASLKLKIYSMDDVVSKTLVPLPVTPTSRIQPNRLVNFVEQRASFEFKTTEMDEHFRINRIVIFMKQIYTSHPG